MKDDNHVFMSSSDNDSVKIIKELNSRCVWCGASIIDIKENTSNFSYIYPHCFIWTKKCYSQKKKNRILEKNLIAFKTHKLQLKFTSKHTKYYQFICEICDGSIYCYGDISCNTYQDKILPVFNITCNDQIIKDILE